MKKIFATLIVLFTVTAPFSALASTQILSAGLVNVLTTSVYGIAGYGGGDNSGSIASTIMPAAGTLSGFIFYVYYVPGGATTWTATLKKNNVATAITCTIASASNTCTDSDSVTFAAGDTAQIVITKSGTPAATNGSWSFVFTPTTANDTIITTASQSSGSSATANWMPYSNHTNYAGLGTSHTLSSVVFPEAGVLDQLQATTSNIVSGSYTVASWKNNATSTLTCNVQSPDFFHCSDTSNSVAIAKGDTVSVRQVAFTPGAVFKGAFATRFVPSTAGNFDFVNSTSNIADVADAVTRYLPITALNASAAFTYNTAEASTTQIMAAATTFTSMELLRSAAPGVAKYATTTLRVNGADSTLVCVLTGTGSGDGITTKTCTGSVAVVAGDLINYSTQLTSGGTTGNWKMGLVANSEVAAAAGTVRIIRLHGHVRLKGGVHFR